MRPRARTGRALNGECRDRPGRHGRIQATARFEELCELLRRLGFTERQRGGSHRIFSRDGIVEILNLQPRDGRRAKAYQVKQVRQLILKYDLAGESPDDDAS